MGGWDPIHAHKRHKTAKSGSSQYRYPDVPDPVVPVLLRLFDQAPGHFPERDGSGHF